MKAINLIKDFRCFLNGLSLSPNHFKLIPLLFAVWLATNSFCQVSINPLIKVGGFIYAFPEYSEFSLHFEVERAFRKRPYFTSGLRLDY